MFRDKTNIANLITFSRIIGIAFIFFVTPYTTAYWMLVTELVYFTICWTDFLDGWIARRFNIVSDTGKILDPIADKILVLVFLPLLSMQVVTAFPVFIILAREFAIMGLRVFSAKQGVIVAANWSGKIKTFITLPICGILMARVPVTDTDPLPFILRELNVLRIWIYNWPQWVFEALIWSVVLVTVLSFFDYLFKFLWQRTLSNANGDKEKTKQFMLSIIPNSISFINLICGGSAIYFSIKSRLDFAAGAIILGIIFDALDGRVARKLGVNSNLGAKLDSRADFMTFGIAPAFLIYHYLHPTLSLYKWGAILVGVCFYIAVHYRLYRFNQGGHSDYFEGLPSPAGAAMVAMTASSLYVTPGIFLGITLMSAALMVSKFPYPHNRISYKKIGFRFLPRPTLAFWFLTIAQLFGAPFPQNFYIVEITLFLTSIYLVAPLVPLRKKFR